MSGHSALYESLRPLFRPQSVAILGATQDVGKIGGRPVKFFKELGFQGPIYPINPNYKEIQGLKAYASIEDVEGQVDQAIMAVPARYAVEVTEACARKGVKSVVAFTSGFAEMDEEGRANQERLGDIARESGMRILGPNCLGVWSQRDHAYSTFSTSPEHGRPKAGTVAIASQSGAFGAHCFVTARERGLGFTYWATTGNECDVEFADCVRFFAEDEDTKVIIGYMEGCRDADKLYEALEAAHAAAKPVILMKVGRSAVGAQAAASHTAAIAGSEVGFDAVFKKFNVYRAQTLREVMDVAYGCSFGRFPASDRLGIVTVSGGAGVLMADAAAEAGLKVPPMPKKTQARLKKLLPFASPRNPVDVTANFYNDWSLLTKNFEAMMEEGDYDAIVSFFTSFAFSDVLSDKILESVMPVLSKHPDRLMAFSIFGKPENLKKFEDKGILVFDDPSDLVHTIGAMARLGAGFRRQPPKRPRLPKDTPRLGSQPLNEYEAKAVLRRAGIDSAKETLAASAGDAAAAAAEIGFPVVLKIVSPDIQHKTEVGGVVLGLDSQEGVRKAYGEIVARAQKAHPEARIDGVLVSEMVAGGVETILGTMRDPVFGPMVMFGLGGVFAEILKDVTFRVAPFSEREAKEMIREIKGFPLLDGARGRPVADQEALARALSQLSIFAAANADTVESIDINPYIVRERGRGAVALDALIVPG